ncbi:MAG: type ISP restriction/modification enzyme [Ginsengibacter sp.]
MDFFNTQTDDKNSEIKWDENLSALAKKKIQIKYFDSNLQEHLYRPYSKAWLYFSTQLNQRVYQWPSIYSKQEENYIIGIPGLGSSKPFQILSSKYIIGLDTIEKTQCLPLYRYENEERTNNITDWALEQFMKQYATNEKWEQISKEFVEYDQSKYPPDVLTPASVFHSIEKEEIFYYVYAVLHNPAYRKKYELNLKREFPRIPFYKNFYQWVKWGEQLMNLHINYETAEPYPLNVIARRNDEAISDSKIDNEIALSQPNTKPKAPCNDERMPKAKLKALKDIGVIVLDDNTELHGIPPSAWDYKLGNRSALEWILDQYKEKKPTDPTIAEKFNTYKFADYKQHVIDLLKKVCTVSVETMKVVREMEGVPTS